MTVPTPEMIAAGVKAFLTSINNPLMIKCDRCDGKGYHHGFGEDGASPDWCEKCGGGQYDVVPGEEERAVEAAITAALALVPGEPVAWRWVWKTTGSPLEQRFADPDLYSWTYRDTPPSGEAAKKMMVEPLFAAPTLESTSEQRPYGYWVKHRLSGGVFLSNDCYIPTGPDYTVTPLYAAPVEPVAVKALEWKDHPSDGGRMFEGQNQKREYLERATHAFGTYFLMYREGGHYSLQSDMADKSEYSSADKARAAAQADYETRIRSALVNPVPSEGAHDE